MEKHWNTARVLPATLLRLLARAHCCHLPGTARKLARECLDSCRIPAPLTIDHVWYVFARLRGISESDSDSSTAREVLAHVDSRVAEQLLQ
eukprot:8713602-Alexandrium_andersonii.AAC.1